MKKRGKISLILGIIAGFIMILAGILTALKITPPITAVGSEVLLGVWRVFAGVLMIIFAVIAKKHLFGNTLLIIIGAFEVLVFFIEKDYTLLIIGPFVAILAGILGIFKK